MKKQNIKKLFDETSALLSELNTRCVKDGILLDNDLETGLFMLLLDDDEHEITLLKYRLEVAIKQIENGTFKLSNADKELVIHQKVA